MSKTKHNLKIVPIAERSAKFLPEIIPLIKQWKPKSAAEKSALEYAFPIVDPGISPYSDRVIIQLRSPTRKSRSGLEFTDQDLDAQLWNEQTARIVGIGPTAFHFQRDGTPWPEGEWFNVGDFVRVPAHRTDMWTKNEAYFVLIRAYEVMAHIHVNPLTIENKSIGVI